MMPRAPSLPAAMRMRAHARPWTAACAIADGGIPLRVYVDRHPPYKSPGVPTLEEQLQGHGPQSQVERVLAKELRLAGIATLLAANRIVDGYLPTHNRRLGRSAPADPSRGRPAGGVGSEDLAGAPQ